VSLEDVLDNGRPRRALLGGFADQFAAFLTRATKRPSPDFASWVKIPLGAAGNLLDRKSTRLNSSHVAISYAVFCLKKKTRNGRPPGGRQPRRDRIGHQLRCAPGQDLATRGGDGGPDGGSGR